MISKPIGSFLAAIKPYLASTVCTVIIIAFIIAAIIVGDSGDILVVAHQIGQWIELGVGHDSPLALLSVHHQRGGSNGHFC